MTSDTENDVTFYSRISEALGQLLERKTDAALNLIEELQIERPNSPEVLFLTGIAAITINEFGRGLVFIEEALKLDPERYEYAEALANLHARVGNLNEGLYFAKLSTTLEPHPHIHDLLPEDLSNFFASLEKAAPPRHYVFGMVKLRHHDYELAERELDRHVQLYPDDSPAHCAASIAKLKLGYFEHAIAHITKAVNLSPNDAETHFQAGRVCHAIGEFDAAAFHFKTVFELAPKTAQEDLKETDSLEILSSSYAYASSLPGIEAGVLSDMEAEIGRQIKSAKARPVESVPSAVRKDRIHVAYITNSAADLDTATILDPILRLHDPNKFRVSLYQQTQGNSAYLQQLATAADNELKIWELDDETAAVIIAGDEIDILVNCCTPDFGYRANLFAMKPSSIQVGYLGANNGIKMPGMTHVVCDPSTESVMRPRAGADQKLAVLDPGLWAMNAPNLMPDVSPLPAKEAGHLTFGAVCNFSDMTPSAVEAFSALLAAVKGSRLLFGATSHIDTYPRRRVAELFSESGLADRVAIWDDPGMDDKRMINHAYWRDIDILLIPDTLNSPLRAAEALWMGVPVLTIKGDTPAACSGASILSSAAQVQWVHENPGALIEQAKEMSENLGDLAELRSSLRETVKDTALFRPEAHVRALEDLYTSLVDQRRDNSG